MVKVNSALFLYFAAILLYVVAVLIGSDNLELFSKPIIIPSIYYFYYTSVKGKISYLFTFSVLSYFIGEILFLLNQDDFLVSSLVFFGIPYIIITFFLAQDFLFYLKIKKYDVNNISFYIILMLLFYLLYNVLSFINETSQIEFSIYIIYGILLLVMGLLSFLIQFNFNNKAISFMVLMIVFFIISDLFYIFSKSTKDVMALKLINVVSQQLSYYLYVGYFVYRTKLYPHLRS
ncbi:MULTISPECIES: hypothetical protein [unclassified Flavobacterium]|uniref:hypothetical protein n=1 Tax=unclassified Flavobacterium TaxID=196869 RepID=UPI001291BBA5|nr:MULTISPECIES: hypothetical protein [unclassified Flavobacterium]MQP52536.1 hypothetical protein [Flavobacterium sp. LMO9]MQP62606.1 hypothetical protein [Flavobacterium sp. LMO6]